MAPEEKMVEFFTHNFQVIITGVPLHKVRELIMGAKGRGWRHIGEGGARIILNEQPETKIVINFQSNKTIQDVLNGAQKRVDRKVRDRAMLLHHQKTLTKQPQTKRPWQRKITRR